MNEELNDKQAGKGDLKAIPTKPSTLEVEESSQELFIFKKWQNPFGSYLIRFTIPFALLLMFMFFNALTHIGDMQGLDFLWLLPFLMAFGVASVLSYIGLAMRYNSTTIHVTDDLVKLSHHPLPWPGSTKVARKEIEAIEIKEEFREQSTKLSTRIIAQLKGDKMYDKYKVKSLCIKQKNKTTLLSLISSIDNKQDEELLFVEHKVKDKLTH
ncbi:MAG: hypothetical protein GY810_02590 [Aureispira sp.]|nr:hypothetical protein [Aureispira sp.]